MRPWGHSGVFMVSVQATMPTSFCPTGRFTGTSGLGAWWVPPKGMTSSSTCTCRPARAPPQRRDVRRRALGDQSNQDAPASGYYLH